MIEIRMRSFIHGSIIAFIDDDDYEKVNQHTWSVKKDKATFYALSKVRMDGGWYRTIYMHRIILGVSDPKIFVDHKDHNGLNNQKDNLRLCTIIENCKNRKSQIGSSSKYVGVSKQGKKWKAQLNCKEGFQYLGIHESEKAAALAYNKKAIEVFGEFANLNKI